MLLLLCCHCRSHLPGRLCVTNGDADHLQMSNVPQPTDDRLVSWAGRVFARFAIENNISCVPVDEVSDRSSLPSSTRQTND